MPGDRATWTRGTGGLRYEAAGAATWDEPRGGEWTPREIAKHVAGVRYYAEQVGVLAVLDSG